MILRTATIFVVAWIALIAILKSNHAESGCRMAYMRPDYIPHSQLVDSKHAMTYGLYLYRDRAWNLNNDISVRVFLNMYYVSYNTPSLMEYRCCLSLGMLDHTSKDVLLQLNWPNNTTAVTVFQTPT